MYGARPNQEFFQYSGFVDPDNIVNDRYRIWISLNSNDPLYKKKKEILDGSMMKWYFTRLLND